MSDPGHHHAVRVTLAGLAVNVLLAVSKLVAGLLGHSYALIADAIESMGDILGSVVIWGGLRYGSRPPDGDHPYGHGKAEALAALAVAAMVLAAGVGIAVKSVHEIVTPHHAPAAWTLIVLVAVVGIKETMFRVARRAARRASSTAVEVDAWHHRSDALTSVAAFIGISVALVGGPGWEPADDWAALAAAGVIVINAFRLMREPYAELMDRGMDATAARAADIARTVPDVRGVEKVHARKSGTRFYVDMHVEVDAAMSVHDAHIVSGKAKAAVRAAMPEVANVLIHVEPAPPARPPVTLTP